MSGIIGGAGSKSGVIGETEIDYEEGTWVPVVQTDYTSWNTVTFTGGTQEFNYVKVGNFVKVTYNVAACAAGNAPSGHEVRVTGYPFTNTGGHTPGCPILVHTTLGVSFSDNKKSGQCPIIHPDNTLGQIMSWDGDGYNFPTMEQDSGLNYFYFTISYTTF